MIIITEMVCHYKFHLSTLKVEGGAESLKAWCGTSLLLCSKDMAAVTTFILPVPSESSPLFNSYNVHTVLFIALDDT